MICHSCRLIRFKKYLHVQVFNDGVNHMPLDLKHHVILLVSEIRYHTNLVTQNTPFCSLAVILNVSPLWSTTGVLDRCLANHLKNHLMNIIVRNGLAYQFVD